MLKLLMKFGDLQSQAARTVPEDFQSVGQAVLKTVRSFIKNSGSVFEAEPIERTAAFPLPAGQKAHENEFI